MHTNAYLFYYIEQVRFALSYLQPVLNMLNFDSLVQTSSCGEGTTCYALCIHCPDSSVINGSSNMLKQFIMCGWDSIYRFILPAKKFLSYLIDGTQETGFVKQDEISIATSNQSPSHSTLNHPTPSAKASHPYEPEASEYT